MCACSTRQNPGSNEIARPSRWVRIIAVAERQSQAAPPPPRPFIGVPLPGRELVGESVAQCIRSPRRRGRAAKVEMKRREFITLVGGTAAWPLAARAQQTKVARIGFLGLVSASSHAARLAALRAGLRDRGWLEGTNLLIEYRWAESNYSRLRGLAEELVQLKVDVLVTHASPGA